MKQRAPMARETTDDIKNQQKQQADEDRKQRDQEQRDRDALNKAAGKNNEINP